MVSVTCVFKNTDRIYQHHDRPAQNPKTGVAQLINPAVLPQAFFRKWTRLDSALVLTTHGCLGRALRLWATSGYGK